MPKGHNHLPRTCSGAMQEGFDILSSQTMGERPPTVPRVLSELGQDLSDLVSPEDCSKCLGVKACGFKSRQKGEPITISFMRVNLIRDPSAKVELLKNLKASATQPRCPIKINPDLLDATLDDFARGAVPEDPHLSEVDPEAVQDLIDSLDHKENAA